MLPQNQIDFIKVILVSFLSIIMCREYGRISVLVEFTNFIPSEKVE
jgi:hypothetical protein